MSGNVILVRCPFSNFGIFVVRLKKGHFTYKITRGRLLSFENKNACPKSNTWTGFHSSFSKHLNHLEFSVRFMKGLYSYNMPYRNFVKEEFILKT